MAFPKFRVGDRIQQGGAPHIVFIVREVKISTYTLAPPDDENWLELPIIEVDQYYSKNAREFNRQFNNWLNSLTPPHPDY